MAKIVIRAASRCTARCGISGAKNAVLPILCARACWPTSR